MDALYRGRGRAEKRICDAKDHGLSNLPSHRFAINAARLALVCIASDLLAWTRLLCLEGELAHVEPKRLRYCLLAHRRCGRARRSDRHRSPVLLFITNVTVVAAIVLHQPVLNHAGYVVDNGAERPHFLRRSLEVAP